MTRNRRAYVKLDVSFGVGFGDFMAVDVVGTGCQV